jgi:hypothetical protein
MITVVGAQFSGANYAANTTHTIISPSRNRNGVMIKTLSVGGGTNASFWLYANLIPPAAVPDLGTRIIFTDSIVPNDTVWMPYPLLIPSLNGLYFQCSDVCNVICTYDFVGDSEDISAKSI